MVFVNVDNFVRAETARMFDGLLAQSGGVNEWVHNRVPTPIDAQTVIRMNRDTLYSSSIVDIGNGASLTMPDSGDRYMSMMVINEDHYINRVFHDAGTHELTREELDTEYVALTLRTLVDPNDPDDLAVVRSLQDGLSLEAGSSRPYRHPDYDETSRKVTANALLELAQGIADTKHMFGSRDQVDPVRHLLGTASGWGGLPESEAFYVLRTESRRAGRYTMTLSDVPVDGFWSVTVYNRDGFLEENPYDSYSVNNVTATASDDGSVTLNFAPEPDRLANYLYVMDGWNYALRLYRPRTEIVDGTWKPPEPQPME